MNLSTNNSSNHRKDIRASYGATTTTQQSSAFNRHWLRIVRTGNNFRGYASSNGSTWFLKFSHTVSMASCIQMGLSLNGYVSSNDVDATFANVSLVGAGGGSTPVLQTVPTTTDAFTVYPNPTSGMVTVTLGDYVEQEATLQVLDVNGKLIQTIRTGVVENFTEEINLTGQPAGIYFVRLQLADGTVEVKRVVLQPRA